VTIRGIPELQTRLARLKPDHAFMERLGLSAIREQKILVPRKTGNLGRSIGLGSITPTRVDTKAGAGYAGFVEFGTKPHEIRPKRGRVLRWPAKGSARLSGAPKSGGAVIFARRVEHPGTKAKPFMLPGARKALEGAGFKDLIIRLWNGR
jgi:hypothetical protein